MNVPIRIPRTLAANVEVLRRPALRRLQLALAATALTTPVYAVALSVYAYRAGGVGFVALVGVVAFLPAGLLAAPLSVLVDRGPRERVLAATLLLRSAALLAGALGIVLGVHPAGVLSLVAVASVASRIARTTQAALLPSLVDDEELVAANTVAATIDEVGTVAGPALAGVALVAAGPGHLVALSGVATLLAALLVRGLGASEPAHSGESGLLESLAAGARTLARDRTLRLPVVLLALQSAVYGAIAVLIVPLAIEDLELGEPGVGLFEVALGLGGVAGGLLALGLAPGRSLGTRLAVGSTLWGGSVALVAVAPRTAMVLSLLLVVGATGILMDVPAYTLVQQIAPPAVLGRTFGALESLCVVATAGGTLVTPALTAGLGAHAAFLVVGTAVLAPALLGWPTLRRLDSTRSPVAPGGDSVPADAPVV